MSNATFSTKLPTISQMLPLTMRREFFRRVGLFRVRNRRPSAVETYYREGFKAYFKVLKEHDRELSSRP